MGIYMIKYVFDYSRGQTNPILYIFNAGFGFILIYPSCSSSLQTTPQPSTHYSC